MVFTSPNCPLSIVAVASRTQIRLVNPVGYDFIWNCMTEHFHLESDKHNLCCVCVCVSSMKKNDPVKTTTPALSSQCAYHIWIIFWVHYCAYDPFSNLVFFSNRVLQLFSLAASLTDGQATWGWGRHISRLPVKKGWNKVTVLCSLGIGSNSASIARSCKRP